MEIVIEETSGFCFGVISAINLVEKELKNTNKLYCLGDIVHNDMEVDRLASMGLEIINLEKMKELRNTKVVIRAHGEPPSTYELAKKNNIEIIDATCPIVLRLQKNVMNAYHQINKTDGKIIIYGKKGHAEVIGLVGQTKSQACVISNINDLDTIDYTKPLHIFSQTTMNKNEYSAICEEIEKRVEKADGISGERLVITDSICRKVSSRTTQLLNFADSVDVVLFVSGKNSSNGTYLYSLCKKHKDRTYFISTKEDIKKEWFENCKRVGISGATSTPMWLMEEIADYVSK
ncbi:MAG: 4-hydroxy-3-methylbut-2-enyl diphosphate reductase [Bacteroidales bacterium]|nr:4-hydroxy-3-methylbut-2-enyl diphosphate reductase [Bacteroidales bacterium]